MTIIWLTIYYHLRTNQLTTLSVVKRIKTHIIWPSSRSIEHHVVSWVFTNVSREHTTSTFRGNFLYYIKRHTSNQNGTTYNRLSKQGYSYMKKALGQMYTGRIPTWNVCFNSRLLHCCVLPRTRHSDTEHIITPPVSQDTPQHSEASERKQE
jgi:hypothetical protein